MLAWHMLTIWITNLSHLDLNFILIELQSNQNILILPGAFFTQILLKFLLLASM